MARPDKAVLAGGVRYGLCDSWLERQMEASMSTERIRCPVRGVDITCRTNVDGAITRVSCPDHDEGGACHRRAAAHRSGPLAQFLERVSKETLADAGTQCILGRRAGG